MQMQGRKKTYISKEGLGSFFLFFLEGIPGNEVYIQNFNAIPTPEIHPRLTGDNPKVSRIITLLT